MPTRLSPFPSALVIALLLLGVADAPAQEMERPHSLDADAWALQFGVGENFTLQSLLGSTVSLKKHMSPARAWQVGVTVNAHVSFAESGRSSSSSTLDREELDITAHYLSYPLLDRDPREALQLYLGVGPRLQFTRHAQRQEPSNGPAYTDTSVNWSLGVSGLVGAEWFVHRRISVSGAYRAALSYMRSSRDVSEADLGHNTVSLNARGAWLGVSAYF